MSWLPKQTIVVPVDFSKESAEAVRTALQLASEPAAVHVIHVMVPLDNVSPGVMWGTINDKTRETSLQKYFQEFVTKEGFEGTTLTIRVGDPGLEIADYARDIKADLIVLPSHGYHGIKRFFLGSVAERVIRQANCPILVLRRQDAE